jgi:hypothetical protein
MGFSLYDGLYVMAKAIGLVSQFSAINGGVMGYFNCYASNDYRHKKILFF